MKESGDEFFAACRAQSRLKLEPRLCLAVFLGVFAISQLGRGAEDLAVPLPTGVQAVWDMGKAHHEVTITRERICINGLWQWQPAEARSAEQVPGLDWGWFKVPGCWPGISDYMQKDCQTMFAHPNWKTQNLGAVTAAWYRRRITVPQSWAGRRIALRTEYINSFVAAYVDGQQVGEIRFPGGELEITKVCRPGETQMLSLLVIAMPLKGVMVSYGDTFGARQVKGTVERRGLCGDVYLVGTPAGAHIENVKVTTSVRRWEITFEGEPRDLATNASYALHAEVKDKGRTVRGFTSKAFGAAALTNGRTAFSESWKPEKLWDTHTPE